MNYTRQRWSKDFHCVIVNTDLVSVVALTVFFCFLPVIFYTSVKMHGDSQNSKTGTVLPWPEWQEPKWAREERNRARAPRAMLEASAPLARSRRARVRFPFFLPLSSFCHVGLCFHYEFHNL